MGRLTGAAIPGHTLAYTYPAVGGCGLLASAGKNTDRATMVDNGVTSTSCYDLADRLTSTTGIASIVYDAHGDTTTLGTSTLAFDNDARNTTITTAGATVTYTRDTTGRIVARTDSAGTTRYVYAGDGDSPAATANSSGVIGERFVALPGGVTVTRRTTTQVWSYPNIHGDIAAIADQTGTKTGATATYDPYGQPSTAPPDNIAGPADWAWQGSAHKTTDAPSGIIQMGARPYQPSAGRFLTVDPIPGGSANDYDYVAGNPISAFDIDGTCGVFGNPFKKCGAGHSGPVGFLGGVVSTVYRHLTVGVSWCDPVCYDVKFQGGYLSVSTGGLGTMARGVYVGLAGADAKDRERCAVVVIGGEGPSAAASIGVTPRSSADIEPDGRDWEISAAPGVGYASGILCTVRAQQIPGLPT